MVERIDDPFFAHEARAQAEHSCDQSSQPTTALSEPNPFQVSWLLEPALRAFAPREDVEWFCVGPTQAPMDRTVMVRRFAYYGKPVPHWSLWQHDQSFLGTPLVTSGMEEAFWGALLDWCDARAGPALFLHCPLQSLDGPVAAALIEVARKAGRPASVVMRHQRAMLRSRLSPEAYFSASTSTGRRKEMRRQLRRLKEVGEVRFERRNDDTDLDAWIEHYHRLERSGWKGSAQSALSQSDAATRFFRDALTGAARGGHLERLSLTLDHTPIAMLSTFIVPPGAFLFKTVYDEAYARFSPGVLLQQENLALLDRPEVTFTDSCAAQDHPMIDRLWTERRMIGAINVAIGGRLRQAAAGRFFQLDGGSESL